MRAFADDQIPALFSDADFAQPADPFVPAWSGDAEFWCTNGRG